MKISNLKAILPKLQVNNYENKYEHLLRFRYISQVFIEKSKNNTFKLEPLWKNGTHITISSKHYKYPTKNYSVRSNQSIFKYKKSRLVRGGSIPLVRKNIIRYIEFKNNDKSFLSIIKF